MEVDCDFISGQNIRISSARCRAILKMLALVLSEIFQTDHFVTVKSIDDGSGGMNAIHSRPEVVDDVISGTDVDTSRCYACVNLLAASFSSF